MASLNLSTHGPSIKKSYQSIVASGNLSNSSPTDGQWAIFSVSAPLVNAFQPDTGKESVLKVQGTGDGALDGLIEEFSDGKVQFAFVKVTDPNTSLPKFVLIAWCGEGVPERTKGYFTSYCAAVAKVLHGYHVQITARSERDLTPEGIVQKVSDASGSNYSGNVAPKFVPPPIASKPAFMPQRSSGGLGYNPLAARKIDGPVGGPVDADGWGHDAPPVTRTQLEKVQSAYQPTKVDMRELTAKQETRRQNDERYGGRADQTEQDDPARNPDIIRGGYQPVGKVDIAALRRQAQPDGSDRPTIVKGAYEPVGKVDIAAIRARAQPEGPTGPRAGTQFASPLTSDQTRPSPGPAYSGSERLTALPKPRIANKFGDASFGGTKAPIPGAFGSESKAPPLGASKTFADEGGKTPAQIWAEKKGRGLAGPSQASGLPSEPIAGGSAQSAGEWKSGYTGKTWNSVQTKTGPPDDREQPKDEEVPTAEGEPTVTDVGSIRDRFSQVPSTNAERFGSNPPPLETSTKPNAPGNSQPAPEPESEPDSPIRLAIPISRSQPHEVEDAREEQFSPPPVMPERSLAEAVPTEDQLVPESDAYDARGASQAMASLSMDSQPKEAPQNRAVVQYDYEKAEENEISLREGDPVINIDMVDADWWMGENIQGEKGLFPSNYVELVQEGHEQDHEHENGQAHEPANPAAVAAPEPAITKGLGATATALYDYEAAEDNELSFPENAIITNVQFPDEDWWTGEYEGHEGLFPANYVELKAE